MLIKLKRVSVYLNDYTNLLCSSSCLQRIFINAHISIIVQVLFLE